MGTINDDLLISMSCFSLATLLFVASYFMDHAILLWLGIALNVGGLWLLHDGWVKSRPPP